MIVEPELLSIFAIALAMTMTVGCMINYAPQARTFTLYSHVQNATNMVVNQDIPLDAKMIGELNGITGIRGDVGSQNVIASPSNQIKLK